jgi:tetratricopeptide (TPR) repeat protein
LTACASTRAGEAEREQVREAIRNERYQEGVSLAATLHERAPEDAQLGELHRVATLAYLLDRGRRSTLGGEDDEALAWFAQAAELAPESERVREWQVKTHYKLADKWIAIGNEAFASENFAGASEAYTNVLEYVPNHPSALSGLGQVTILINYRTGLGEDYYKEGIRALSDYRLRRARRGFTATTKYLPDLDRAVRRATEVDRLLAQQRVEVAKGFELDGLYAAALNEFRFAHALDGENPEATEGLTRLELEAEAAEFLRDARMKIYRRQFGEALELLEQGEQRSISQQAEFEATRESILGEQLEALYQRGLDLEHDGLYAEAIGAYADLLRRVEYFKDARARKSTLEGYIEMAASYYEKAMAAQDPAVRLEHLRSIEGFWPDYKSPDDKVIGELIDDVETPE